MINCYFLPRAMRALGKHLSTVAALLAAFFACHADLFAAPPVDDPDYMIQGEYDGDARSLQVIALGEGEFDIIVYDSPLSLRHQSETPPRTINGDEETVAALVEANDLKRVERTSPTLGKKAPAGAKVLFDGSEESLQNWKGGKLSEEGLLISGTTSKDTFGDYSLHVEFRTPWMPKARGQGRGNSGVYHQGRYETQVLDSFGLKGENNETGGIYSIKAPDVNACLPPMQWQTYDVDFTAATFQDGKKIADARLTVWLNGEMVQNDTVVSRTTTAAPVKESADPGPIYLQDHGNPVRYRNIWIQPRDAAKEARRPIVPGFERFFSGKPDEQALGGEILISNLSCTACHKTPQQDALTSLLPEKKAPSLAEVAGRVRNDALVAMISDPHGFKPNTAMPDPWAGLPNDQRLSAAASIASYLLLRDDSVKLLDRAGRKSAVQQGRQLYHSVGCVACHKAFEGTATPDNTNVPLGAVERKYTIDSLAKFILEPHKVRSGGRMPSLVGSQGDAYSIAAYLTRAVTERKSEAVFTRKVYKGNWQKLPDFDALKPVSEDTTTVLDDRKLLNQTNTGVVLESKINAPQDGVYEFILASDDGSRLIIGENKVDVDGVHPRSERKAKFNLKAGVHPIRIEFFNAGGGGELSVKVNDPKLGLVDLQEIITDGNQETGRLLKDAFQPDPALVETGKQLFRLAGCASCHDSGDKLSDVPQAPGLATLQADRGCLAETVSKPAMDFNLSPRQKQAIVAAIEKRRESPTRSLADADRLHLHFAALNCYACHRRNDLGGNELARDSFFQSTIAEMGWEGRTPPPLDGVGDKLQDNYIQTAITGGANVRNYMQTRMPGFGEQVAQSLTPMLVKSDRPETTFEQPAENSDLVSSGRKLVGSSGLSCVKCHSYEGLTGGGLGAMDLRAMPKRLRHDWFVRYLQDPTKYRPGTRMPNSFPDGKSSYDKLYHGDPVKQVDAMWAYLATAKDVKEPTGVRSGTILLSPGERPLIYRNFFNDMSARGIAVGFPGEANLIWDAERMSLGQIWKSEFIDAAKHWTGRGQGRTSPAGAAVQHLERWTPIKAGTDLEMAWSSEIGRDLGYRFKGYQLDSNGNPTFRYQAGNVQIDDAVTPLSDDGLKRSITVRRLGDDASLGLIWRMAQADKITQADGKFVMGDLQIAIEGGQAKVVTIDGKEELRVAIPAGKQATVTETLQW